MQKISDLSTVLHWSQPSVLRMEYELLSEGELVGTLKLRGMLGTLANAESGDGSWTFKRVGFWQNRATIRESGSEADLAIFRNNTWAAGGELEFDNGRVYRATTNFWLTRFRFCTVAEEPLVSFTYGGVLRRSADVEIAAAARALPEVPLLVLKPARYAAD